MKYYHEIIEIIPNNQLDRCFWFEILHDRIQPNIQLKEELLNSLAVRTEFKSFPSVMAYRGHSSKLLTTMDERRLH